MRKLVKALLWIAGGIAAVAVAIPLTVIAVNAFDEELSAEARALAAPPQPVAVDEDNGYVEFLGLDAPAGEGQRAWGLKVLASLRAQDASPAAGTKAPAVLKSAPLVDAKVARWCNPAAQSCLAAVPADATALLKEHALAIERYRTMQARPRYMELYVPDRVESAFPSFGPMLSGQAVSLLAVAVAANAGNIRAALDGLEREMAFHRRMLAGSRSLLGKMVANSLLARDAMFLSDLMRAKRDEMAPHLDRIATLLRPLSAGEASLAAAHRNDTAPLVRYMLSVDRAQIARDAGASAWWMNMAAVGYQRNATANHLARQLAGKIAVDEAPAASYQKMLAAELARAKEAAEPGLFRMFVNPTGRILVDVSTPVQSGFTGRMHDLRALLVLVALQGALLAASAQTSDAVEGALASDAYASYRNPYTGGAMSYDAPSRTLYFPPASRATWVTDLQKRWNGRVAIQIN